METVIKEMEGLTFTGILMDDVGKGIKRSNDVTAILKDIKQDVWVIRPVGDIHRELEEHYPGEWSLEKVLQAVNWGSAQQLMFFGICHKNALVKQRGRMEEVCDENNVMVWNLLGEEGTSLEFDMTPWFERIDNLIEQL